MSRLTTHFASITNRRRSGRSPTVNGWSGALTFHRLPCESICQPKELRANIDIAVTLSLLQIPYDDSPERTLSRDRVGGPLRVDVLVLGAVGHRERRRERPLGHRPLRHQLPQ